MGLNKSKFSFLSYEDACRRVSDTELKRLKEAFKKHVGSGTLTSEKFFTEVLGGFVPQEVSSVLFKTLKCSNNVGGLTFKDLLVGLVLICVGKKEEKQKFLFSLFCNDSGSFIERASFEEALNRVEGPVSGVELQSLFKNGERASWEQFREWINANSSVTLMSQWLLIDAATLSLTDDSELPTFYQTLAGVTHLSEEEIIFLEQRYWSLLSRSTNLLDFNTFEALVSPPFPKEVVLGLFRAFDENNDGHIDLKEMACGISACCHGPVTERQKFCFKVFDSHRQGQLRKEDLCFMLQMYNQVCVEGTLTDVKLLTTPECMAMAEDIIASCASEERNFMNQEEYIMWTMTSELPLKFMCLLRQVCVIVLGLRPRFRDEELSVITDWLTRFERIGPIPGTRVYLISKHWWNRWLQYVSYKPQSSGGGGNSSAAGGDIPLTPFLSSSFSSQLYTKNAQNGNTMHKKSNSMTWLSTTATSTSSSTGQAIEADHPSEWESGNTANNQMKRSGVLNKQRSLLLNGGGSPSSTSSISLGAGNNVAGNSVNNRNTRPANRSPVSQQPQATSTLPPRPGPLDNSTLLMTSLPRALMNLPSLTDEGGIILGCGPRNPTSPVSSKSSKTSGSTVTSIGEDSSTLSDAATSSSSILNECRAPTVLCGRDYELLPEPLWLFLLKWYGGPGPALPRNMLPSPHVSCRAQLELDPLLFRIVRHITPSSSNYSNPNNSSSGGSTSNSVSSFMHGLSVTAASAASFTANVVLSAGSNVDGNGMHNHSSNSSSANHLVQNPPKRQITHRACFSRANTVGHVAHFLAKQFRAADRDSIRLWLYRNEDGSHLIPLDDDNKALDQFAYYSDMPMLLLELRNPDLTWPEELCQLAKSRTLSSRRASIVAGVTGLSNLGNTCFFNAAVQCGSNTRPLTQYFTKDVHLYELNQDNLNGTKGRVAQRYGELIKEIWSGNTSLIAPLKVKLTIERHASQFSGFAQHDTQELLAFLLDGLHEDLNRVKGPKPYRELKDSDGRPDAEVAQEVWDAHISRNKSIIVDLFHGLLRSQVRCRDCHHISLTFDPFSFLSLPLPMENNIDIEVFVIDIRRSSLPVKHVLLLSPEATYGSVKLALASRLQVYSERILLSLIENSRLLRFPADGMRILRSYYTQLYAYLFPNSLTSDESGALWQTPSAIITSSNSSSQDANVSSSLPNANTIIIAYHRKLVPNSYYFLANSKITSEIFGTPCFVQVTDLSQTKNSSIYAQVWDQVARLTDGRYGRSQQENTTAVSNDALVSVSKTSPGNFISRNHAQDGDITQLIYPFTLKHVTQHGMMCSRCSWTKFCRGCFIPCNDNPFSANGSAPLQYIAIDWETTALHLRYQSSKEKEFEVHSSVLEAKQKLEEPMSLYKCLEAFTREEDLDKEELYSCSKCKDRKLASKKLDLWKMPPILIFHLKRFQHVRDRWQKSLKIVHFPIYDLDLKPFLRHMKDKVEVEDDDCMYDLYAIACHGGSLQYGHYVVYAKNPNGKWYLFNDSICKEIPEESIDMDSAYLLFYERRNLNPDHFLPDISGKEIISTDDDDVDNDLKRMCVLQ